MTRLEAESVSGLRLLKRSAESETAARAVFLECAAKFSPRIEEACADDACTDARSDGARRPTACAFVLDIAGTERLFGPPAQLAERLREELAAAGFRASVAVSANYDTARMKAASMHGIAVIPEGAEAEALARLPIAALDLDEEYAATFALWGIGTLGELAALPEAELVARVGPQARRWRALARGAANMRSSPLRPEFSLEEFCEFEAPVEQIDSLLFVGARMIDCLVTRAAGRALALSSLKAEMRLEGGRTHCVRDSAGGAIRRPKISVEAAATGDWRASAAGSGGCAHAAGGGGSAEQGAAGIVCTADAGAVAAGCDAGAIASDGGRRARGVAGARRYASRGRISHGGVSLPDPEARLGSDAWQTGCTHGSTADGVAARAAAAASVRWCHPQHGISTTPGQLPMKQATLKPVSFRDGEHSYEIAAAYGPWRTSGCWWARGRMGHGGVGCAGRDAATAQIRGMPADARLRAECVATGGVLRLTAAPMFRMHARRERRYAIPTMSIGAAAPMGVCCAVRNQQRPSTTAHDSEYIELHATSAFSFLAGGIAAGTLIQRAVELEMPAIALADRNGVYGAARFHTAAQPCQVKAHIGAEIAVS